MANTTFKSLTHEQEAYKTKRGKEFRASFQGFAAKDAEVREVGNRFAVGTFANLSGAKDLINAQLGFAVEESEYKGKKGTVYSIPANFTVWTNTQAEADAIAAKLKKGAQISAPVRVSSREYNDKIYIEMNLDELFIKEHQGGGPAAPAVNTAQGVTSGAPLEIEDDDLPF